MAADRGFSRDRTGLFGFGRNRNRSGTPFLRLADAETSGGSDGHSRELIAKAVAIHNVVLQYIENMRGEFETEKRELWIDARRLLENIRAAERRRRQSNLQILAS